MNMFDLSSGLIGLQLHSLLLVSELLNKNRFYCYSDENQIFLYHFLKHVFLKTCTINFKLKTTLVTRQKEIKNDNRAFNFTHRSSQIHFSISGRETLYGLLEIS